MDSETSSESGFGAFVLGLAVGVGVGILFAPRTGHGTRRLIARTTREGIDRAAAAAEDLKTRVQTGISSAEEAAHTLKDRVGETVSDFKDRVQDAVRAGQQAYREDLKAREPEQPAPSSHAATSGC